MEVEADELPSVPGGRVWKGIARVRINAGETVCGKSDCAIAWNDGITVSGGLQTTNPLRMIYNRVAGVSSITEARYKSSKDGAVLLMADPDHPGSIGEFQLESQQSIYFSPGLYLGRSESVELRTVSAGIKSIMQSLVVEGVDRFLQEARAVTAGPGKVFFSAFGDIIPINIPRGESYTVDNGHLVAFTATLQKSLGLTGSAFGSWISGEGVAFTLSGPGTVFVQTQSHLKFLKSLVRDPDFIAGLLTARKDGGAGVVDAIVASDRFIAEVRSKGPLTLTAATTAMKSKL